MYNLIYNSTRNVVVAEKVLIANGFWQRMRGLMGKKKLSGGEGLLLVPCNAIHMLFMHFPIDVVFLSRDFTVLKIMENLKPWRIASCRNSYQVLELEDGILAKTGTGVGDKLIVRLENIYQGVKK